MEWILYEVQEMMISTRLGTFLVRKRSLNTVATSVRYTPAKTY